MAADWTITRTEITGRGSRLVVTLHNGVRQLQGYLSAGELAALVKRGPDLYDGQTKKGEGR